MIPYATVPAMKAIVAAAFISVALMVAAFMAPVAGATETSADPVAARIDMAFSAISAQGSAGMSRLVYQARKGDLPDAVRCGGLAWSVTSNCLMTSDGNLFRPARAVTVGYQDGEATTILVRRPAPLVAAR